MTTRTHVHHDTGLRDVTGDYSAIWRVLVRSLHRVDPYLDVEEIDRSEPILDETGWGFAEFRQLMDAVAAETGVVVAEEDYPLVASLGGLEQYLSSQI